MSADPFSDLEPKAAQLQRGVTVNLTDLLGQLWQGLSGSGSVRRIGDVLERQARAHAFQGFELGAAAQQAALSGGGPLPAAFHDLNARRAVSTAALVRQRAEAVLAEHGEAFVSPYAQLAAQVLVTQAVRAGTGAAGTWSGATRKQFVRIRPVQEPRAHSTLEGVIKPVDEPYNIGGYLVDGPGDERLPWSEKAWCGHILRYLP